MPGRARDVEVPVDGGNRVEAPVPIGRPQRAAPLGELRMAQNPGRLLDQRKVADQDRRQRRLLAGEPPFGFGDPQRAPGLAAGMRVGVQHELVDADDAGLLGAFALIAAYPFALLALGFTSPVERRRLRALVTQRGA